MLSRNILILLSMGFILMASCSSTKKESSTDTDAVAENKINFNEDSAYSYVSKQVEFGARVPNTEAHRRTGEYLEAELRNRGAWVSVQDTELTVFDGTILHAKNIIGEFNPDSTKRILFIAHWDSRPWADNDPDVSKQSQPVMGANDGASGVGVLLELARIISLNSPNVGIDIIFVDAEDWGNSSGGADSESSWALGTQYWTKNMHRPDYAPQYGILLDMVGAKNARFSKEYLSMGYAPQVVNMIWNIAKDAGYSEYFVSEVGGAITDDHVFVNRAGIPCIDIIDQNGGTGFFPAWHTTYDTMVNISPATLKAVGQTLTNLIYKY
ncbi:MAG: M28 family peptidase [Muribaculaceae bacterium]